MPVIVVTDCQTAADVWRLARQSEARRKAWNAPKREPKPDSEPPKEPEPAVIHRPADAEQDIDEVHPRPTVQEIIRAAARAYGFRSTDLKAARRDGAACHARHVSMLLSKILTLRSFPHIGRTHGGRDHTTALYACSKLAWLAPQLEAIHTLADPVDAWAATAARLHPLSAMGCYYRKREEKTE